MKKKLHKYNRKKNQLLLLFFTVQFDINLRALDIQIFFQKFRPASCQYSKLHHSVLHPI